MTLALETQEADTGAHAPLFIQLQFGRETGRKNGRTSKRATQDWQQESLSADDLKRLIELLPNLPASKAEPPTEQTVYVSFQSGDKWRTETYDAAKLPAMNLRQS